MRSNASMANRQGDVDLRFAQVSAPVRTLAGRLDGGLAGWLAAWKALNPNWNSKSHKRRICLLQLGKELAGVSDEAIQKTVEQTRETSSETPIKASCTICSSAKDRKTKTACSKCSKNVCQKHSNVMCIRCQQN